MESHSLILSKISYGSQYNHNGYSPFEILLKHLMQEKAQKIYPAKQSLAQLQMTLIKTAENIKRHAGDPKKTEQAVNKLQILQKKSKKIIHTINQIDDEFNSFSNKNIENAKNNMGNDLLELITQTESILGKNLSPDLKKLFFDDNGMPISSDKLAALVNDRVKTGDINEQ